eukprot:m.840477 g.840477  ORF g.840477 m.840477 type:complete len:624 (-) comp59512_c1_seq2:198-2069(-)
MPAGRAPWKVCGLLLSFVGVLGTLYISDSFQSLKSAEAVRGGRGLLGYSGPLGGLSRMVGHGERVSGEQTSGEGANGSVPWNHLNPSGYDWDNVECSLGGVVDKCTFVQLADACQNDGGFINYLAVTYCQLNSKGGAIVLFIFWLLVLFVALSVTAEEFFCPALNTISKALKLSDNVAGVTFLALGNGAPDIFSVFTSVNSVKNGIQLALGELFGSGLFVTTVVAGSVAIAVPYTVTRRPFLRDVIFYILAVSWTYGVFWDGQIFLGESIGYLALYVSYVCVVIFGRRIFQAQKARQGSQKLTINSDESDTDDTLLPFAADKEPVALPVDAEEALLSNDDESECEEELLAPWPQLFAQLAPFEIEDFKQERIWWKAYDLIKAPIVFFLRLTIPVVDEECLNNNWCRYLAVFNCVACPVFLVFATQLNQNNLGGTYPTWLLALVLGSVLAILVWATSRHSVPPAYHNAFAFLGFVMSVIWIYSVANEIVNLLQTFGVLLGISADILGLTVLAWGNSIGDAVANLTVAKQGFPRMAIGACFGSPLMNILIGIGLSTTVATLTKSNPLPISRNGTLKVSGAFLLVSLFSSCLVIPFFKFSAGRKFGIYLICLYVAFMITAIITDVV